MGGFYEKEKISLVVYSTWANHSHPSSPHRNNYYDAFYASMGKLIGCN